MPDGISKRLVVRNKKKKTTKKLMQQFEGQLINQ